MSEHHVACLEYAKAKLTAQDEFICNLVMQYGEKQARDTLDAAGDIVSLIESDLSYNMPEEYHGCFTYNTWLRVMHNINIKSSRSMMIASRKAWIDAMIEYWRNK